MPEYPDTQTRLELGALAESLRRYVEDGGRVDYFRTNRPNDLKRIGFEVEWEHFAPLLEQR